LRRAARPARTAPHALRAALLRVHAPPSTHSSLNSSNGHGLQLGDSTLARSPSRLVGADGPLAPRLSGWFKHLAGPGSTSDLSIAGTISGCFSLTGVSTATVCSSTPLPDFEPRL
jgi:hypothetical protein